MATKVCRRCWKRKPLSSFYEHKQSTGSKGKGVTTWCKRCYSERDRKRAKLPRFKLSRRALHLRQKHGITVEQYDEMLKAQGGGCAICGSPDPQHARAKYFCVDHNHKTGKRRALLCWPCNLMIGHSRESVERLRNGATYLERFIDQTS